jgi:hypothetical protein
MDLTLLASELELNFVDTFAEFDETRVLTPPVPTDLGALASDFYPDDLDEDNAYDVIGEAAPKMPLITLRWHEDGAEPFDMTLDLVPIGDLVYVTISPDFAIEQPWEAVAAFESYTPAVDAPFFLEMMKDNGTRLGVDVLSSLPTTVITKRLEPITVLLAWRLYLRWDEERNPGAWRTAAEYLPSSLRRFSRLEEAAKAVTDGGSTEERDEFLASYVAATFDGLVARSS